MDIGLRKFVKDHPDLLAGADAMLLFGSQSPSGGGGYGGGSEGCVYVELTTSGKAWGRGPTGSDIHGSNKRSVDSPAWRHIKMLASLVSDDGNTPMIEGFYEGMQPIEKFQEVNRATPMFSAATFRSVRSAAVRSSASWNFSIGCIPS